MKTKLKTSKGITLIALVITIIVLLILAGVSIAMLTGDNGILTQAQRAKTETENAAANEQARLDEYNQIMNNWINGGTTGGGDTTGGTLGTVTGTETSNTTVQDSLGNKVVVPAGFKVVNPTDNVEDGIIIEDVNHGATAGSQFVWIPVGTIQTSKGPQTITLGRYVYKEDGTIDTALSKTEPGDQLKTSSTSSYYCTEGLKDSTTTNMHAKDIEAFISKVNNTGGYYIGRYEARTATQRTNKTDQETQITVKPDEYVYNYVTQPQAADLSRNMYSDSNFESDLVNSYAWDTAIDFLQKCDDRADKTNPYSMQNSLNISFANKGTNGTGTEDVICNIYDMASNCFEWTTETCSDASVPCVNRGGHYDYSYDVPAGRYGNSDASSSYDYGAFRPLLYL